MKPADRQEFFRRLRDANPSPRTELEYSTAFELLVAVILSAQATDRSVNLATRKLFAKANTPQTMLALGTSRELLGHGSLGAGLDDVLGPAWSGTRIDVFPERHGLLLVLLPPGAFILLGLMLAIRNRLAQRRQVQRGAAIAVEESRA